MSVEIHNIHIDEAEDRHLRRILFEAERDTETALSEYIP